MTTLHLDRPVVPALPPTTEVTGPAVWTCRIRGCNARVRIAEATIRTTWRLTKPNYTGTPRKLISKTTLLTSSPLCPEHRTVMRGKAIEGVLDESIKCGPKCTEAAGHSCRCACGGANHGTGVA